MASIANLHETGVKQSKFTIWALVCCAAIIRYLGNALIAAF